MHENASARVPATRTWRLPAIGRCASVCALVAATLPPLARAGCKIETLELPVRMIGTRATATVEINGTPVPLTVDSGAFFSMLTDAAAAQLHLPVKYNLALNVQGVTGKVAARMTTVDKLKMFNGEIERVDFVVGGNEPGAGTMGFMGRNILAYSDVEYDLAHGAIRFHYPNDDCKKVAMAYWAGDDQRVAAVDLLPDYRSKTPAIRARVTLNGTEVVALFDTGATTVVTARAARRAGIADADLKPAGAIYGAGRGRAQAWTASFARFELGGETVADTRLAVGDFDLAGSDMLLGIDFFLSHRLYVSKQQSKAFITYNGGPVFFLAKREPGAPAGAAADGESSAATADELARRGAASAARRDFDAALADLNRACDLEPTSAALRTQRGALQVAARHPDQARADFDRALELDPTYTEARAQRALLRFNAKDRAGAKADLDVLDQALPPQSQLRLTMSLLYLDLDEPAQTVAQLDRWLPAHPNEVRRDVALNRRCWARARLGTDLDRALDDCDDALGSDEKNSGYLDSRGWVLLRLGKYQKALADFDRSIESRPGNAWALYGRGLTKTRMGDEVAGEADLVAARKALKAIDRRVLNAGLLGAAPATP